MEIEEHTLKVGGVLCPITDNIVIFQAYVDELESDYVILNRRNKRVHIKGE